MHIGNKYVHWQTTLPTVTIVTLVDIFQMVLSAKFLCYLQPVLPYIAICFRLTDFPEERCKYDST